MNRAILRNFATKHMKSTSSLIDNKLVGYVGTAKEELTISSPFEAILGCVGNCALHTISFYAGKHKIKIDKMEADVTGDYDSDYFLGKKEGRNTFSNINLKVRVYSNEEEAKLKEAVEEGHKRCPVVNTVKLAGIDIKTETEYIKL